MGTEFTLRFYANTTAAAKHGAEATFARVRALEHTCSDYLPDSELTALSRSQGGEVSPDLFHIIESAQQISRSTDGAFDITTGHYSQMWRRSRRRLTLPTEAQMEKVRHLTGYSLLRLDAASRRVDLAYPGMQLDLGGIAKGWAADAALAILREHGIRSAIVAASGDLAIGDAPPNEPEGWQVDIQAFGADESRDSRLSLRLKNCGLSTSGDVHQFVEIDGQRYSHIIDPKSGLGLTRGIAATVIAPTASLSDPLATACCIMGAEAATACLKRDYKQVRFRIVELLPTLTQSQVTQSPDWPPPSS